MCEDVYGIVEKMLGANKVIGPYARRPQFDFAEVHFILDLLGVAAGTDTEEACSEADLWISDGLVRRPSEHGTDEARTPFAFGWRLIR